ncbi:Tctex1 domain-containing protein 2, partial [Toxocara canis]
ALNLPRYKYVVQVVIGEQRGQGARIGGTCMWDCDTDTVSHHLYTNVRFRRCVFVS